MKYVFASILVLVALVTVFHVEKVIPIPRAIGGVMNSTIAKCMPFGIQAAYAESCVSGLEGQQDRTRYAVSDATVKLRELDRRIAGLREARDQSVTRLKAMVKNQGAGSEEAVGMEVARHDDLQWKLTHAQETRNRIGSTLESLESAEGRMSQNLTELNDRLDIVQLDHEHNNARELAAELVDSSYLGKRSRGTHGAKVIEHMEHKERVREEIHHRYGPTPGDDSQIQASDPWERAKEIADKDC